MTNYKKKSLLFWIYKFSGNKKPAFFLSIILAVFSVACSIAPYLIIAKIISQLLGGVRDWNLYLKECLWTAAFQAGASFFHAVSTSVSHLTTFNVLGNIRKAILDKLTKVPLGSVLNMPSGSLKNTIIERIDSMETTLAHILPEFTSNLLLPVLMFIYMFNLDWRMGFATLAVLPFAIVACSFMMIGYEVNFSRTIEKTKILNDTAVEYINGIEVIKAFGKSKSSYERFVTAAKEGADCFIDWMRACIWPFTIAQVLAPSTLLSVLPIGGWLYMKGSLEAVDFIKLIILSISVIQPLLIVYSYMDDIAKAGVIFGEVGDIFEMEELNRPEKDLQEPADNSIKLTDVRFSYKREKDEKLCKEILHGINMELKQNSYTAFVGPSGSGKSTIARLIASLWDVDSGSIEIGGVNIKNLSLEEYNKRIAFVSQDNFLFDMSIRDNIRLGKSDASDKEVEEIAKKSGCYDFIMSLENGFDTVTGSSGTHLSGGERQRIAIARAMLKDAPIVILDEATAYTDPENEALIQKSVSQLVKDKTLIVIAHRLSTIRDADNIYVINNGNIDSWGSHEELLKKNGLYKEMWQAHISGKDKSDEGVENV
ncbi:ABC transporter ATP-binding protein [Treponema sp.]|uniref:ABC transporter ATP-binding protein n=1 Tax=Treponema sp. TaxID=166 RepID=UPI0025FB3A9D|nr:ABC transporter ATP-binding protein [Treponema sp.]MCR5218990.1 ABC transporter ATP-binding protein/permease [Treponema sp.]